jgi:chemotaxis protein MotA
MNITTLLGLVAAFGIVWGVVSHAARPEIFLDSHALLLVFGGTLAAALIAFPVRQFKDLMLFLFMGALFPSKKEDIRVIEQVLRLSGRPDFPTVDEKLRADLHPFLAEGYLLMQKDTMTTAEFKQVLMSRRQRFKERNGQDAKTLTALAKFPPAFGLLGATTGMIAMMTGLGASGKDTIGPAMAVALVATFWGIAIANFILLPLADHANRLNAEDQRIRQIISTGLVLIHQGTRPMVVLEHLIGFLQVGERSDSRLNQAALVAQNTKNGLRLFTPPPTGSEG